MNLLAVHQSVVVASESEGTDIGPGSIGFWVVVALGLALFVLYRSLRKQMRRVDFNPEGSTDEERMRKDDAENSQ